MGLDHACFWVCLGLLGFIKALVSILYVNG